MTGRARVHARGRRRDTPPSEPAQPEAARGHPMPPVPRTDPPLSFADLVRRGTAVSSLTLFSLCKRCCLSRKEGDWWLSRTAPLLLWSSLLLRESRQKLMRKVGLCGWAARVGRLCLHCLLPFLVCIFTGAHRLSSNPEWMERHPDPLASASDSSLGSDLNAGDFIQACEQTELDRISCFV